jgi:hypothetical protein
MDGWVDTMHIFIIQLSRWIDGWVDTMHIFIIQLSRSTRCIYSSYSAQPIDPSTRCIIYSAFSSADSIDSIHRHTILHRFRIQLRQSIDRPMTRCIDAAFSGADRCRRRHRCVWIDRIQHRRKEDGRSDLLMAEDGARHEIAAVAAGIVVVVVGSVPH